MADRCPVAIFLLLLNKLLPPRIVDRDNMTSNNLGGLLAFTSSQSPLIQSSALTVFNPTDTLTALSMNCHPLSQHDDSTRKEQHPLLSVSDINLSVPGCRRRLHPLYTSNVRTRRNREGTIFGNNTVGRKGKPRCDKCRKRKSKVRGFYISCRIDCSVSMLQPNRPANSVFPVNLRNLVLKDSVQKQKLSCHRRDQFQIMNYPRLPKTLLVCTICILAIPESFVGVSGSMSSLGFLPVSTLPR
jgi:hypothetical protein